MVISKKLMDIQYLDVLDSLDSSRVVLEVEEDFFFRVPARIDSASVDLDCTGRLNMNVYMLLLFTM